MSYQPLPVNLNSWPYVEGLVRGTLERLYFEEVHALLRLPIPSLGLLSSASRPAMLLLLAVTSGISVLIYRPGGKSKSSFINLLLDYYPWDQEGYKQSSPWKQTWSSTLYKEIRNPMIHSLGVEIQTTGQLVHPAADQEYDFIYKRLLQEDGSGLSEEQIELIEQSSVWPSGPPFDKMCGTFEEFLDESEYWEELSSDSTFIPVEYEFSRWFGPYIPVNLERFYWGVRKMLTRLCEQGNLMKKAELFLSRRDERIPESRTFYRSKRRR